LPSSLRRTIHAVVSPSSMCAPLWWRNVLELLYDSSMPGWSRYLGTSSPARAATAAAATIAAVMTPALRLPPIGVTPLIGPGNEVGRASQPDTNGESGWEARPTCGPSLGHPSMYRPMGDGGSDSFQRPRPSEDSRTLFQPPGVPAPDVLSL